MIEQGSETSAPTAQQIAAALNDLHLAINFHKPYFNTAEAAAYVGRTISAFRKFEKRSGLVRMGDGTIARRDLDRIKRQAWTAKRGPKSRPLASQSQKAR